MWVSVNLLHNKTNNCQGYDWRDVFVSATCHIFLTVGVSWPPDIPFDCGGEESHGHVAQLPNCVQVSLLPGISSWQCTSPTGTWHIFMTKNTRQISSVLVESCVLCAVETCFVSEPFTISSFSPAHHLSRGFAMNFFLSHSLHICKPLFSIFQGIGAPSRSEDIHYTPHSKIAYYSYFHFSSTLQQ